MKRGRENLNSKRDLCNCCPLATAQLGINQRGKRNNNKSFISIITDNDRDEIKEKTTNRNLYIFLQLCCFN